MKQTQSQNMRAKINFSRQNRFKFICFLPLETFKIFSPPKTRQKFFFPPKTFEFASFLLPQKSHICIFPAKHSKFLSFPPKI